jgi:ATP-dependent helicase/nuclease subunit A
MTEPDAIAIANAQQRAASDPRVSVFAAASAGSGKTKLLTDRLLRLMFAGTAPEKILCLTYTKAAAAEMTIRLNRRLGQWVVLPEPKLAAALAELEVAATQDNLARARKFFAQVLDLPGGMRIQTIHAFCQSLLRRFPFEAGLSPHFEVADEREAARRLRESREAALAGPGLSTAIGALAAEISELDFAELIQRLSATPTLFAQDAAALAAMQRGALGAPDAPIPELQRQAVALAREITMLEGWRRIAEHGNTTGQKCALSALDWLGKDEAARIASWQDWVAVHFTKDGDDRKTGGYFGKKLAADADALAAEIARECERLRAVQEQLKAARLAELNIHLSRLAAPILQGDRARQSLAAQLSYGDLVRYTEKLFDDPGAAWILYKLDGGIEHLLLDEVQDTAPAQWEIADKIADEFFAGFGTRQGGRTIFAVGDAKQSIFSFQGADLASFETYRARFRDKVRAAGQPWADGALAVSFRSTAPVLALVDAVFAEGPARAGVVAPDAQLHHAVSRLGQAGRVTLWPLVEAAPAPALPPWSVPDRYAGAESQKAMLARRIATEIKSRLDAGEILPSRQRAATPGDFLILVRRRDALVTAITSAAKAIGLPIAGLDRMVLTDQQAVADLLALCDALLLPEDDLAVAHYLASPLGGLSDDSLMALALGRRQGLAATLFARRAERPEWGEAWAFFEALRSRLDFLSPFALLSLALGPLGGRARLLRRLGAEAAEPIDELLTEALGFSQRAPGALQLFVHALRQSGAEVTREAEAGGDLVRIMTVHGAKGLQAPVVILPDTTGVPNQAQREQLFWLEVPQQAQSVPVFCPRGELRSETVGQAAAKAAQAQAEEANRLLYVALTRAEDELLVCGVKGKKAIPASCWYNAVQAGFARLGAVPDPDGVQSFAAPQTAAPDRVSTRAVAAPVTLPGWAGGAPGWQATPPPRETARPERIAPSRSTEDTARQAMAASPLGPELAARRGAREAALAKGRAVHALLQHLPDLPAADRRAAAQRYCAGIAELADRGGAICDAVLGILENPALGALFAPGSRAEIPLAGVLGDVQIGGLVDRLAVTAERVLIADYKTDHAPPATPEQIPPEYLRQLAAYRAILRQIYPDRPIDCLLIWTETAAAMPVASDLLASHAPA